MGLRVVTASSVAIHHSVNNRTTFLSDSDRYLQGCPARIVFPVADYDDDVASGATEKVRVCGYFYCIV